MMKNLLTWVGIAAWLWGSGHAIAQEFPAKPIELVIGTTPGGAVDVLGRALAEGMTQALGAPVVTMSKVGANGVIAVGHVAQAKRDGHTVGYTAAGPFVVAPFVEGKLSYKVDDLDFLCQTFELPIALAVPPNSPIRTLDDFVRVAKSQPGKINFGHTGPGSLPQIALSQLEKLAGVQVNQVPYKGDAEVVLNLIGGHLDAGAPGLSTIGDKNVRILAIFSNARVAKYPDVPTVKELGYSIVKVGMVGLYAQQGLPSPVRSKLTDACRAAVAGPAYKRASESLGQSINYLGPVDWTNRIAQDALENRAIIEQLGKKP